MKVYIHIGYPKTGSTAIQWHVFANRDWFEKRGVYIPRTGYWSGLGHAYLAIAASTETALTSESSLAGLVNELDECSRAGFNSALLTWEGFALAGDPLILALGDALAEHEVVLLAYVRDQASLFQSLVLQSLKNLRDFSQVPAVEQGAPVKGVPDYLDFHAVFARWESIFTGQLTVRVRLFDRTCLRDGDVVTDFLGWLGLSLDEDFSLQRNEINDSLSAEGALQLISARSAGLSLEGMIRLSRALTAANAECRSGSSQFLDPAGIAQVTEQFSAGNVRLFERYRPENIAPDTREFAPPKEACGQTENPPVHAYLRAVQRALTAPKPPRWGGGHLQKTNVGRLVALPNQGWRGPEKTGAWSLGPRSELAFIIPSTHPRCGPNAIRLLLTGTYFEGHSATRVIIRERSELLDLRGEVVLTIPIDEDIRAHGVHIVLEHQFPTPALDDATANRPPIAYKLRSACYDFVWN